MAGKTSGPNLFGNLPLMAAALALGAFLFNHPEVPIQGSRPTTTSRPVAGVEAAQDVDARLWQDPFGAMWRDIAQAGAPQAAGLPCEPDKARLSPHSCTPRVSGDVLVLGVMLPGDRYAEGEESRRQVRYAVVSSLAAKNYAPDDAEHIGYF
ncbi:MAG TPA: hypothetical protein VNH44_12765, partial [Micropepsaceae bacterium]|nr:hypothetical protein [Micropepsaceae bacterium]